MNLIERLGSVHENFDACTGPYSPYLPYRGFFSLLLSFRLFFAILIQANYFTF